MSWNTGGGGYGQPQPQHHHSHHHQQSQGGGGGGFGYVLSASEPLVPKVWIRQRLQLTRGVCHTLRLRSRLVLVLSGLAIVQYASTVSPRSPRSGPLDFPRLTGSRCIPYYISMQWNSRLRSALGPTSRVQQWRGICAAFWSTASWSGIRASARCAQLGVSYSSYIPLAPCVRLFTLLLHFTSPGTMSVYPYQTRIRYHRNSGYPPPNDGYPGRDFQQSSNYVNPGGYYHQPEPQASCVPLSLLRTIQIVCSMLM